MSLLYNFPVRTSFYPFCLILQDVQLLPRSDSVDEFSRASGAASNPYSSRREITEELSISCARDKFLRLIHSLHPAVVTLYEEDCDTTSTNLAVCRLTNLYEHEWLPFDFLATFLQDSGGRINEQLLVNRLEYERNVGRRIHNTICAFDGVDHFPPGNSGFVRSKIYYSSFLYTLFIFLLSSIDWTLLQRASKNDTDDILFDMVVNLQSAPIMLFTPMGGGPN